MIIRPIKKAIDRCWNSRLVLFTGWRTHRKIKVIFIGCTCIYSQYQLTMSSNNICLCKLCLITVAWHELNWPTFFSFSVIGPHTCNNRLCSISLSMDKIYLMTNAPVNKKRSSQKNSLLSWISGHSYRLHRVCVACAINPTWLLRQPVI